MSDKRRKAEEKVEQTGEGVTVAVTGVSGFIAGVLAQRLLDRGYTVRGTVRDLSNKEKVKHLEEDFPGLQLYEADLLKDGSFEECFKGCKYIFHTASPFQPSIEDPMENLVKPALHGTENVIRTALATDSVQRIVVTSSVAAVRDFNRGNDHVFTEDDWNESSTVENGAYPYSKTVAEKKAWELVKDSDKSLVTICPSFVLGPPQSKRMDSVSTKTMVSLLDGSQKDGCSPSRFPSVDVEDVCLAHIRAAEIPEASGRYILSLPGPSPMFEIAGIMRRNFPKFDSVLPTEVKNPENATPIIKIDNSKAQKELSIEFTPLEATVVRTVKALISLSLVSEP